MSKNWDWERFLYSLPNQSSRSYFVAQLAMLTPRAIVDYNYRTDTITLTVPEDYIGMVTREMQERKQMGIRLVVKKMTIWQDLNVWNYVDLNGDSV